MKQKDLALFAKTERKVRLTRRQPSESRLNGYVLGVSEKLLLMHCFDDFEPDGYTICRNRDIVDVRCGPYEEWFDYMLRSETLLGGLKLRHRIDLSTWTTAIRSVARHYSQMIIECEDGKTDEDEFFIGKTEKTGDRCIEFRDYDALGYWSPTPKSITLAKITKIQFDTPYIKVFSKYTRDGTPPEVPNDESPM